MTTINDELTDKELRILQGLIDRNKKKKPNKIGILNSIWIVIHLFILQYQQKHHLLNTIGNYKWLAENEQKIKECFPNKIMSLQNTGVYEYIKHNLIQIRITHYSKKEFEFIIELLSKVGLILVYKPSPYFTYIVRSHNNLNDTAI